MSRPQRPARAGYTLVELLVALALLAIALSAVVGLTAAQQRTYAALAARRAARTALHDAAVVLARDLRPAATDDAALPGDLREVTDSTIELLATLGAAVACAAGPSSVDLPAADGVSPAWWTSPPQPGDALVAFDAGTDSTDADGRWREYPIVGVAASATACDRSAFTRGAPRPGGLRLTLAGPTPLPPTVGPGAPVRLGRRRRWSHYRAGDGAWYLGLREWDGARWSDLQPVAGPLRSGPGRGLAAAALDAAGAAVRPPAVAAAVRVVLRADVSIPWSARHAPAAPESTVVWVAPRGTRRDPP